MDSNCVICGLPPQSYAKEQGIPEVGLCPAHFREAIQWAAKKKTAEAAKEASEKAEAAFPRVRGLHGYLPFDPFD